MNVYHNSKIYKIVPRINPNTEYCYIGSTTLSLKERYAQHKRDYIRYLLRERKIRTSVFDIFDDYSVDDCMILLIERFRCKTVIELRKREGYWIRQYPKCVNKYIAGRTKKEWIQDTNYIEDYGKIKFECLCESKIRRNEKSKHFKTEKHKNLLKELKEDIYLYFFFYYMDKTIPFSRNKNSILF